MNKAELLNEYGITPTSVQEEDSYYFKFNNWVNAFAEKNNIDVEDIGFEEYLKWANIEYERIWPDHINKSSDVSYLYLEFPDGDVVRASGYYNSYNGDDFSYSEWESVKKVTKTITVYE